MTLEQIPIVPSKSPTSALYDEATIKLEAANETLSHAQLFPGKFNSVEIRKALQQAAEAVSAMTELDILLNDGR